MDGIYKGIDKNLRYKKEEIRRNCSNFQMFTFGGMIISGLILLLGILRGKGSVFTPQYMFFFLYMVLIYIISRICNAKKTKYIVGIYYGSLLPIFIVSILMGTYFDPKRQAITIMVFLCGMTLFVIDKPWRLLGYIVVIAVAFTLTAFMTKDRTVFTVDLINIEIFGIISLAINYVALRNRIENVKNYLLMQENRENQELIISNLPTGIIVFKVEEMNYKIVQINPAVCKIMNIDPKAALNTEQDKILELIHPDDKKIVYDAAKELTKPGGEVHYEFRSFIRSSNTYRWNSADGKSVEQSDGSLLAYIGYADITDRRSKEEEYQKRISALIEMDDENVIAKGQHNLTQNKVIFFTPKEKGAAKVDNNGTYDEAVEALVNVVKDNEQKKEIIENTGRQELIDSFYKGKTDDSIEFSRVTDDGRTMWTMLRLTLFEEPKTKDVIAFMYSYDVTERVTERKIVTKLGNMEYDLFGLVDARTQRYTLLSELNHVEKSGLISEGNFNKMAMSRISKNVDKEYADDIVACINVDNAIQQLTEKDIYSVVYTINDFSGERLRKRFQFTYLDETKESIMFFRSDITELYKKEQIQLKKIENALKDAEIASSAKTEFFSRMSHDMRTPMNGILGLATLSENENDVKILKDNISKIGESGQYLLGLINDTLDFQRIESGRLELEPKTVKVREVVENIIDMVKETAKAKGVSLITKDNNIDLDCYIKVDQLRIKQIFVNLLSNAIKFTPAGGIVEFTIVKIKEDKKKPSYKITVRDTGIGMSEEFIKEKIFQAFSQESNSITTKYAGSGLGLSIAKSLAGMMGGRIEVQSELGVGSSFSVYLDIEIINAKDVKKKSYKKEEYTQNVNAILLDKHILLVEDHPLNAEIARRILEKAGCKVDWLQNGKEAVDYFENPANNKYDVVLMDIRMPIMDGLEATYKIREMDNAYAKNVPIVAMTANAYAEDKKKSKDAGMNAHLSKPIEPKKLFDTIIKVISKNK